MVFFFFWKTLNKCQRVEWQKKIRFQKWNLVFTANQIGPNFFDETFMLEYNVLIEDKDKDKDKNQIKTKTLEANFFDVTFMLG